MGRAAHEFERGGALHGPARVEDHDAVGDVTGAGDVVGDVEEGDASFALERIHEIQDANTNGDVQHGCGFVGEAEVRRYGKCAGNGDALSLPVEVAPDAGKTSEGVPRCRGELPRRR